MGRRPSPTAVWPRRCWDMDRAKRASLREGPLAALFRSTEEEGLEPRAEAAPVAQPEPPRAAPPAAAPTPVRRVVDDVEIEERPQVRSYEERLRHVFSSDVPENILDRSSGSRPMYGRDEPRPVSTPQQVTNPILRVVGVGGAGVNAVNRMIE